MPFLIPLIPVAASIVGAVSAVKTGGAQRKALSIQDQLAQQEMGDKQKIFDILQPFFQQYLGSGSPFLSQIQRASAEQNAQSFNNAAGQVRNTMSTSGLGFGPSGATAAAIGGLGANAAATSSSDYLTNLLNNENLKFQAAKGLTDTGAMAGGSQNQPNVSTNVPYTSPGSSIFGLSQALQNLIKGGGDGNQVPGTPPGGDTVGSVLGPIIGSGVPTTTGDSWGFGPNG